MSHHHGCHKQQNLYFYLPDCPHCQKADRYIEDICRIMPEYKEAAASFRRVDESAEPEVGAAYEYYYVPTFYVRGKKVHEGTVTKRQMLAVLQEAARRYPQ